MKITKKKLYALFLSGLCSLTLLSGCSSKENNSSNDKDSAQHTQQPSGTAQGGEAGNEDSNSKSLGQFSLQDIEGNEYTEQMFTDYDVTMVNVFTTWCTPCINEIPDLQKLSQSMKEQNVQVVGIVLDGISYSGKADKEAVEKAKLLAERTGASYPFLIPDKGYMNGRLAGIEAVPETFFVDKEGRIVGETYSGSRSLDAWTDIVEKELKGIKQ